MVLRCTNLIGLAYAAGIMGAVLVNAHASTFTCNDKSDLSLSGRPSVAGDIFVGATDATARNRLREIITEFRKDGLSPISIVNTLVGAYCPLVAADGGLSNNEKTMRVQRFARDVTALAYASPDQPETDILVEVTLSPGLLDRVDEAAQRAGISRELWIARAINQELDVP